MNVNLTPELDRLVREKVKSGMYGSASEVVREALRKMLHGEDSRMPDQVAEAARSSYGERTTNNAGLRQMMERIWADQKARGHVPPTKEEVDQRIKDARKGWVE